MKKEQFCEAFDLMDEKYFIEYAEKRFPSRAARIKRYVLAAGTYAAAILVVAAALPFIIGTGKDPTPTPGIQPIVTDAPPSTVTVETKPPESIAAITEEPPAETTASAVSVTDIETTAPYTEPPVTETEPHVTEPLVISDPDTLTLNDDLLSEYGMTYGELKAKHGGLVGFLAPHGGCYYRFKTGYGLYFFGKAYDHTTVLVKDTEGNFDYAPIDDNEVCCDVIRFKAADLFSGEFDKVPKEKVSSFDGIEFIKTIESPFFAGSYESVFRYTFQNNTEVYFYIIHKEIDYIEADANVNFSPT